MALLTPNQLAVAAACFNCYDDRTLMLVQIYLLNQILANGGTGGGSGATQVFNGTGAPTGVVTPTGTAAIYFDNTVLSQPKVWDWNGTVWTKFIG